MIEEVLEKGYGYVKLDLDRDVINWFLDLKEPYEWPYHYGRPYGNDYTRISEEKVKWFEFKKKKMQKAFGKISSASEPLRKELLGAYPEIKFESKGKLEVVYYDPRPIRPGFEEHLDDELIVVMLGETAPGLIISENPMAHVKDGKNLVIIGEKLEKISCEVRACRHKVEFTGQRRSIQYRIS
jgi:hypothetical protein